MTLSILILSSCLLLMSSGTLSASASASNCGMSAKSSPFLRVPHNDLCYGIFRCDHCWCPPNGSCNKLSINWSSSHLESGLGCTLCFQGFSSSFCESEMCAFSDTSAANISSAQNECLNTELSRSSSTFGHSTESATAEK